MIQRYTVLVTGTTGNQGGAVADALMAKGHQVRALTRNVNSPAAQRLAKQGAEVLQGNFDDADSVKKALQGVDSFYLMGSPFEGGVMVETQQGIRLAEAAKAANIGHLVYGSVANADQSTGIPHFDSKFKVEQYIKTLGIPYSISAPVYFMDNLIAPWSIDALKAGKITAPLLGDRKLQQVSVKNIGEFVASLIERRESVFGQRFDIAGDELTGEQSAAILSEEIGFQVAYESYPVSVMREQSEDMALMYEWFDHVGYSVNIAALRKEFSDIDWQDYRQWVVSRDWRFFEHKKAG